MTSVNLIGQHLNRDNLKLKVYPVDTVCAFTGKQITEGVRNSDLIKKTFTDHEYLRYPSEYSSIDAALCIEAVIPGKTRMNALRNYSYLATEKELIFLDRSQILDVILWPPAGYYVLCCTYSNKKHTAYKAVVNHGYPVVVTTDINTVEVTKTHLVEILPIIRRWYTVIPEKQEQTYSTKKEIETGIVSAKKIERYGVDFFEENARLDKYRGTQVLKLLVHILNKNDQN